MANTRLIYSALNYLTLFGTITPFNTTQDAAYPVANLIDGNPAKPGKLSATGANTGWKIDFGSATQLDLIALITTNFTSAMTISVRGHSADNWAAASLQTSALAPAVRQDGHVTNPWFDLMTLFPTTGDRILRYWWVTTDVQVAAMALGELFMSITYHQLLRNFSWGHRIRETHDVIEHRTQRGRSSIVFDLNTTRRTLEGEIQTTDAGYQDLVDLWRSTRGRAKPFLVIPDPTVNDAWFVRWTADTEFVATPDFINVVTVPFGFEEVSRGVPL